MQTPETSLTLTRTLKASPQEVFTAWTDPGTIHRWMSGAGGTTVAEVDARVSSTTWRRSTRRTALCRPGREADFEAPRLEM